MKQKSFAKTKSKKMSVPAILQSLHHIYCHIRSDPAMFEVAEHVLHAEELLRQMRELAAAVAEEALAEPRPSSASCDQAGADAAWDALDQLSPAGGVHTRFRLH
jgi:hypothetical protein